MDIFEQDQKITLISDLNHLINEYGIQAVQHALTYIKNFPVLNKVYLFRDEITTWRLTQDQFDSIYKEYKSGNKITAIKLFRELTYCTLKEAKDAIENYFEK